MTANVDDYDDTADKVVRLLDAKKVEGARRADDEGVILSGRKGATVYSLTEDAIARAFADQHHNALRFSHDRGRWLIWEGTRWREDPTDLAFDWARSLCRSLNAEGRRQWAKAATAGAVERMARADRAFAMRGDEWDADPWLLMNLARFSGRQR